MNSPGRIPLAELTAQQLDQRALEYRRMAIAARGQAVASALDRLAIRYAVLAAHREVEETARLRDIPEGEGDQSELAKLIALANGAVERKRDPVEFLIRAIKQTVAGNADPYLVVGALLEGAVYAICTRIPNERLNDTAKAAMQLLKDRLQANGLVSGNP